MSDWSKNKFKSYLFVVHLLSILFIILGFQINLYFGIFSILFIIIGLLYIWFKAIDLIFEFKEYVKVVEEDEQ